MFATRKKHRDGHTIAPGPVRPALLDSLDLVHGIRFGMAVSAGIPLNLMQKWLGHAYLTTTAIYADAVGAQEKNIARRM